MAKVPDSQENVSKCICAGCPSYTACMKDKNEILYCARGKSECDVSRNGCLCGDCPVFAEFDLEGLYYCIEGTAG